MLCVMWNDFRANSLSNTLTSTRTGKLERKREREGLRVCVLA